MFGSIKFIINWFFIHKKALKTLTKGEIYKFGRSHLEINCKKGSSKNLLKLLKPTCDGAIFW